METHLRLSSPNFQPDERIPETHTCEGDNRPPTLEWSHPPKDARSFALIVDDPDAPNGTFTHWTQWNIPGEARSIGDSDTGVTGRNDFHTLGYRGPCPPPRHGKHHYRFHLFALDVPGLDLEEGATRQELEEALDGHVLAKDVLTGSFERI